MRSLMAVENCERQGAQMKYSNNANLERRPLERRRQSRPDVDPKSTIQIIESINCHFGRQTDTRKKNQQAIIQMAHANSRAISFYINDVIQSIAINKLFK